MHDLPDRYVHVHIRNTVGTVVWYCTCARIIHVLSCVITSGICDACTCLCIGIMSNTGGLIPLY